MKHNTTKTTMRVMIAAALLLLLTSTGWAQETGSILVTNATVITVTNGTLEDTDVLVRDGKIVEIGSDLTAPNGVETVDGTGMYLMPGIIDAHSHIAIESVNEGTSPITAEVQIGDVIDPYDVGIYRALAGGVTATHAMHGSANVIGGQGETIKLRFGEADPDILAMEGAPRTIKFALGENPTRVHGQGSSIVPRTRMGVEQVIRDGFERAKRYRAKWDVFNGASARDKANMAPPHYDLQLETLADILAGDIIVHCHSYRADEIYMLLNVLGDYGVDRITFQHVNEGFKVAPELAEYGAGASVFADWWAYKFEVYYSTAYNAAILARNGVVTSINSDSGDFIRHLYHQAAKTQRYGGLTDDEALALITINPAKQLGVEDRIGSIEVGKDGDLALFSAHPLSIYAVNQMTWVDGVKKFDREADPDDMRMSIDPDASVESVMITREADLDRCMEGVSVNHFFETVLESSN